MVSQLVLGCGTVGQRLVDAAADRHGDLIVLTDDEDRVGTLRDEGVDARTADPTNRETISDFDGTADFVLVLSDDPATNRTVAELVADELPTTYLIVYLGWDATPEQKADVRALADRVISPEKITAGAIAESVTGDDGRRVRGLQRTLRRIDGTLGIVAHDNPDPDAIASATALAEIASDVGVDSKICYGGEISHQENRAFVNLLDLELFDLETQDVSEFGGIALVDHSRPGVNDSLPEGISVDVVIDHHPPRGPVEARFVDLRSDVGATSTILTDYLRRFDIEIPETVATALLYGIHVDTKDFRRGVSEIDFEAAAYVLPFADTGLLERVETPSISGETLDTIARAIRDREVDGPVLTSGVGELRDRDALAQAADRLLDIEGITTALVYGYDDETIYVSARARGTDLDLGETLRAAFDQIGSAGGHVDMAGAQLPFGLLTEIDDEDISRDELVRQVITGRFSEALRSRPSDVVESYGLAEMGLDFPLFREDPKSTDRGDF